MITINEVPPTNHLWNNSGIIKTQRLLLLQNLPRTRRRRPRACFDTRHSVSLLICSVRLWLVCGPQNHLLARPQLLTDRGCWKRRLDPGCVPLRAFTSVKRMSCTARATRSFFVRVLILLHSRSAVTVGSCTPTTASIACSLGRLLTLGGCEKARVCLLSRDSPHD